MGSTPYTHSPSRIVCPPIKKAVYQLVKEMVEWKVQDRWDEENNWLLEGRTVIVFNSEI